MANAAPASGYSGTPLPQKLGLKDGQRLLFIALPKELKELRTAPPASGGAGPRSTDGL